MSRPSSPPALALAALALLLAACGEDARSYPADPPDVVGGDRPAHVHRPDDYDPSVSYPLVVLLHGYGVTGNLEDLYLRTSTLVTEEQFLLVLPDGTEGPGGLRFWNATDACCAPASVTEPPDDVGYLRRLVEEVSASHHVDPDRVFAFGHSNGGFMSFRLACEAPDLFAGIATLAGATFDDFTACAPGTPPVSVLAIHGTADETILYEGNVADGSGFLGTHPSAHESLLRHADLAGCDTSMLVAEAPIDFDTELAGAETLVERYGAGCAEGTGYALWTIEGGAHIPAVNRESTRLVLEWLFAHGR